MPLNYGWWMSMRCDGRRQRPFMTMIELRRLMGAQTHFLFTFSHDLACSLCCLSSFHFLIFTQLTILSSFSFYSAARAIQLHLHLVCRLAPHILAGEGDNQRHCQGLPDPEGKLRASPAPDIAIYIPKVATLIAPNMFLNPRAPAQTAGPRTPPSSAPSCPSPAAARRTRWSAPSKTSSCVGFLWDLCLTCHTCVAVNWCGRLLRSSFPCFPPSPISAAALPWSMTGSRAWSRCRSRARPSGRLLHSSVTYVIVSHAMQGDPSIPMDCACMQSTCSSRTVDL